MYTAREMKKIALHNCEIIKYLETKIVPMIEEAAAQGCTSLTFETDDFHSRKTRRFICDRVLEYLNEFGYFVDYTSNYKQITIDWNIKI
jgi:hypothetical protein